MIAVRIVRFDILAMIARCAWDLPKHPALVIPLLLFVPLWLLSSKVLRGAHRQPRVTWVEWLAVAYVTMLAVAVWT